MSQKGFGAATQNQELYAWSFALQTSDKFSIDMKQLCQRLCTCMPLIVYFVRVSIINLSVARSLVTFRRCCHPSSFVFFLSSNQTESRFRDRISGETHHVFDLVRIIFYLSRISENHSTKLFKSHRSVWRATVMQRAATKSRTKETVNIFHST